MKEIYSNAEDCKYLARKLCKKLGGKFDIYGVPYEVVDGYYHSLPLSKYSSYSEYKRDQIHFYYKFSRDNFLRIGVENCLSQASYGHKLAALSDIYEALLDEFGEPTVFFSIKDDEDEGLHFQWNFVNKEETIEEFMHGFPFDDGEVDLAIVIGKTEGLNEETRKLFSRQMALPYELLPLINENIEEYVKYKFGSEKCTQDEKNSGSYQKVISSSNGAGR